MTGIVWTRNCSASQIFGLVGLLPKSVRMRPNEPFSAFAISFPYSTSELPAGVSIVPHTPLDLSVWSELPTSCQSFFLWSGDLPWPSHLTVKPGNANHWH